MTRKDDYLEMKKKEQEIIDMCDKIKVEVHRLGIMVSQYYQEEEEAQ